MQTSAPLSGDLSPLSPTKNFCHPPLFEVLPLIEQALREDLAGGDWTSQLTVSPQQQARALCYAKESLVVCGLLLARQVFLHLDPLLSFTQKAAEGDSLSADQALFEVQGTAHSLLAAERVALNFLQHLSGIATLSRRYAEEVRETHARVVDTRKTIPGLRGLQKYAVRVGGCFNHRSSLQAGVLIKENHIRAAGSVSLAVQKARQGAPHPLRVEVEVASLSELEEALQAGAEIVLLDNMNPPLLRQAVEHTAGRALLEASGNVTLENLRQVALTGVDFISVGALTHSSKAVDISMIFVQDDPPKT